MRGFKERVCAAEPRVRLEFHLLENQPDYEACLIHFMGNAQRAAFVHGFVFCHPVTPQTESNIITYIKHFLDRKDLKAIDENMQDWFNSMNAAGVICSLDPCSQTSFFKRRDGEMAEFSYERVVKNDCGERQGLLSWANGSLLAKL